MTLRLVFADRNERRLLTFASAAHALSDGCHLLYPSLLFLVALDFHENYFFLGVLANIIVASAGLSGIAAGFLADRLGTRAMLGSFIAFTVLGCVLVFASRGEVTLALAFLVFGAGTGIYHPVGLSAITRNVRRRSEALGVHGLAGSAGASLMPVVMISVGVAFGWRNSFLLAAFVGLALVPFLPLVPREFDRPRAGAGTSRTALPALIAALSQRRMLAVYGTAILREFALIGFMTFLTTAIAHTAGLSQARLAGVSTTGLFASLVVATGGVGSFVGGGLGGRYAPERVLPLVTLATVPILLALGAARGPVLLALAPLVTLTFSMGDPMMGSLLGKFIPATMHGKGFAILYGVGMSIGSLVGLLSGAIAQTMGVNWVFPIMAAFPFASLPILVIVLWRGNEVAPADAVV